MLRTSSTARAVIASLLMGAALLSRVALAGAPGPAKVVKLDARPMLGPFAQIDDFCRSLRKAGLIDCAKTGARSAVGARGAGPLRIQAARLVPIRRVGGSSRPVEMAIAMRVAAGWFVDPGRAPERAKRTDDVRIDHARATIKWLDGMGAGVLAVSVERSGEVHRIRRTGADTEEATTARDERDERYCGIGPSGLPSCTDELVSACNGSLEANGDFEADYAPQSDTGRLTVIIHDDNRSTCTFGLLPVEAQYDLPLAGIRRPGDGRVASFIGPFASLETHCREMQEPSDGRCLMEPGRWGGRVKPLGARGRVRAVRLFRVRSSMAGVPVEYCRVAVATADGWYVKVDGETCKGDFGSGSRQAEVLELAWADGAPDPAFVIKVHERHDEVAYLDADDRQAGVDSTEMERAQLCSVPANGPPVCGPQWIAACQDQRDRRWRRAPLTVEKGVLQARPDAKVECASGPMLGDAIGSGGS